MGSDSSERLPICLVDDDLAWNMLDEQLRMELQACGQGDREVITFSTLRDALELLSWERPYVLILDHNMKAGRDPEVAERLGADPEGALYGYHLSRAIRKQNVFGLAIPIVYFTAVMGAAKVKPDEEKGFVELLMDDGPFLPDMWQDKLRYQTDEVKLVDLVGKLDSFFVTKINQLQSVASRVVLNSIDLVGSDPDESSLASSEEMET